MADQNQQKETLMQMNWISELVKPRPSNTAKIITVWDELSKESQIEILSQLRKMKLPSPYLRGFQLDQAKKVRLKALESKNAFIRYLAARDLHLGLEKREEEIIKERIKNDPDPFVRYSDEDSFNSIIDQEIKNPVTFWGLSREARLAKMAVMTGAGTGGTMAELLSFAVEGPLKERRIGEEDLEEVINEYVSRLLDENWFEADRLSYDGLDEYSKGKWLQELWEIVPKLPLRPSYLLIKFLPSRGGLGSGISEEIVKKMSDSQLRFLLEREDIGLTELRRNIFLSADKDSWLKEAAVSHNFDLTYEEFGKILAKPKKKKEDDEDLHEKDDLHLLAWHASDLSLCIYAAISNVLDSDEEHWNMETKRQAETYLEQRISKLKGQHCKEQQRELWLYYLAYKIVENKGENIWGGTSDAEVKLLEFTKKHIVEGDIWRTFTKISEAWKNQEPQQREGYEKILARFYGDGTEEMREMNKGEIQHIEELRHQKEFEKSLIQEFARVETLIKLVLIVLVGFLVWMFFRK